MEYLPILIGVFYGAIIIVVIGGILYFFIKRKILKQEDHNFEQRNN